ncbi:MAG: hypothetical protein IPL79_14325 [Myxococcales bacterium]|nr:hypothetical protein [Myxococcales bacterium]
MSKQLAVSVVLGLSWLAAGACVVGDSTPPGVTSDAAGDASGDGPQGDGPGDGSQANCEPAQTPVNGHHNPGENCQVGGCHLLGNTGAGAPTFYASGTLYNDANGTQAVSGATIVLVTGPATRKVVTAANGNFYLEIVAAAPFTTKASKCPDETPMNAAANTGDCNSCHQVGTQGRIHLP